MSLLNKVVKAVRNRIDEIVLFQKFGADELAQIVRLMLGPSAARLAAREVEFEVTDAAVVLLAERGYEPEYGARPLRRVIQREIDDRIADLFVSGALGDGEGVRVDAANGEFVVAPVPRATVQLAA